MFSANAPASTASDSPGTSTGEVPRDKSDSREESIIDAIVREDSETFAQLLKVDEYETTLAMRSSRWKNVPYVCTILPAREIVIRKAVELGSVWSVERILKDPFGVNVAHIGLFHACRLDNARIASLIIGSIEDRHELSFFLPLALALARKCVTHGVSQCGSGDVAAMIEGLGFEVPLVFSIRDFHVAVTSGCIELVELTHSPGYEFELEGGAIDAAKRLSSHDVIAWLERHGVNVD